MRERNDRAVTRSKSEFLSKDKSFRAFNLFSTVVHFNKWPAGGALKSFVQTQGKKVVPCVYVCVSMGSYYTGGDQNQVPTRRANQTCVCLGVRVCVCTRVCHSKYRHTWNSATSWMWLSYTTGCNTQLKLASVSYIWRITFNTSFVLIYSNVTYVAKRLHCNSVVTFIH